MQIPAKDVSQTPQKPRVLIVDDEPAVARHAAQVLAANGYTCEVCASGQAALTAIEQHGAEVVLTAMPAAGLGGIELLRRIKARRPDIAVILMSANPSVGSAVAAMRQGAFDYVTKPFEEEDLTAVVGRAVEMVTLKSENRRLRQQLDVASTAAGFIAESIPSKNLLALVRRVAPARSTVLIEGESGTGKELVARLMHYWSLRAEGPFVAVNCKAFADGVVESELFGHEKGSFTGAIASRAGCFERATGGTLFLDEIAEAGSDFQAKLLRVLEDGEVLRVGANKPRKVDVRIVAATNRQLRKEVAENRFRTDLFFRLNVISVFIAPLRDRHDDILPLARHFLAYHSNELGRPLALTPEAEGALLDYAWPGNVRELENVIERAVVMSGAELLGPEAFALETPYERPAARRPLMHEVDAATGAAPAESHATSAAEAPGAGLNGNGHSPAESVSGTLQECLDRTASERIRAALGHNAGNRAMAAAELGVDRTTLYRLMKRLEI